MPTQTSVHKKPGFTIVELLVVVVIIGILASVTLVAYNGFTQHARMNALVANVKQWGKLISIYEARSTSDQRLETGSIYCLSTECDSGAATLPANFQAVAGGKPTTKGYTARYKSGGGWRIHFPPSDGNCPSGPNADKTTPAGASGSCSYSIETETFE